MAVPFFRRVSRPLVAGCLMLVTLGGVAGCGSSTGDLSGKVSYQGKPVGLGSVLLIGADAKPRTARIQEDGSYCFADVPVGEAKLAVYSHDPAKQAMQAARRAKQADKLRKSSAKDKPAAPELPAVDRTKWFAIPTEYSDVDRSGLRVTIDRGLNTYHLDMK